MLPAVDSPPRESYLGALMSDDLTTSGLLADLRDLIETTRLQVATTVNRELVALYWQVGHRIRVELLDDGRAAYGERVVSTLSRELTADCGRGFSRPNLHRMIGFAEAFPDAEKVSTLSNQLSWSHFTELLLVKDPLARDFYVEMCRIERWSVRTLRERVGGMLFERTAQSKKPEPLIRHELDALAEAERVTPEVVFRDPYFLDFLGLKDTFSERDLESAILRELEAFILELGSDFTFVARQKRLIIGGEDYYLDLLFFHRALRRLIVIELKLDRFKPSDKGQVELYLRWLDKHERRDGEESPLGLILCASKSEQVVELLELEASGIHVAEYLTELPPRELLERRLGAAIERARSRSDALLLNGPAPAGEHEEG